MKSENCFKLVIFVLFFLLFSNSIFALPFSATWDTTKAGSASNTIVLPITGTYIVDWGDGTSNNSVATHVYAAPGIYTINITNIAITGFSFENIGDKLKLIDVTRWGDLKLGNSGGYFYGCENFDFVGSDNLNLSGTTNLNNMFRGATRFNGDIDDWNTSSVTTMNSMFQGASSFNGNIGNWNTGSVIFMGNMFNGATSFNQDLNDWNTDKVTSMSSMFYGASSFNGNISNWNTSSVTLMSSMFYGATSFNQNLSDWNVSQVTDMANMFQNSGLSTSNYDALLLGWSNRTENNGVIFSAGNTNYSQIGLTGRNILINTYGWIISDGGQDPLPVIPPVPSSSSRRIFRVILPQKNITVNKSNDSEIMNIAFLNNITLVKNVTIEIPLQDNSSNKTGSDDSYETSIYPEDSTESTNNILTEHPVEYSVNHFQIISILTGAIFASFVLYSLLKQKNDSGKIDAQRIIDEVSEYIGQIDINRFSGFIYIHRLSNSDMRIYLENVVKVEYIRNSTVKYYLEWNGKIPEETIMQNILSAFLDSFESFRDYFNHCSNIFGKEVTRKEMLTELLRRGYPEEFLYVFRHCLRNK